MCIYKKAPRATSLRRLLNVREEVPGHEAEAMEKAKKWLAK